MFSSQKKFPAVVALIVSMALFAACSVPRPYERNDSSTSSSTTAPPSVEITPNPTQPAVTPSQTLPESPPLARPRGLGAASKALVAQAQTQLNAGNDELAAATIERALRIEPNNPLLWIELAKIRQTAGNSAQAENLARKALAMAVGDGRAQAAAWRVIADTYRARGRNPDAREADARANALAGNSAGS